MAICNFQIVDPSVQLRMQCRIRSGQKPYDKTLGMPMTTANAMCLQSIYQCGSKEHPRSGMHLVEHLVDLRQRSSQNHSLQGRLAEVGLFRKVVSHYISKRSVYLLETTKSDASDCCGMQAGYLSILISKLSSSSRSTSSKAINIRKCRPE